MEVRGADHVADEVLATTAALEPAPGEAQVSPQAEARAARTSRSQAADRTGTTCPCARLAHASGASSTKSPESRVSLTEPGFW
eukprot:SAG11_NODE_2701_length_3076_cov_5.049043_3_plen_83_part_00